METPPPIIAPNKPSTGKVPPVSSSPFTKDIRRKKLRSWGITAVIAAFILSLLGLYLYTSGRSTILILDTSKDITITLNGQKAPTKLTNKGYEITVFAGSYRLQIAKTHYLPFVQDILLGRGQSLQVRPAYAFQPTSKQSEVATVDYVRPSVDEKSVFYLGDNRKTIYRMNISSQIRVPLTTTNLHGVSDVQWSSQPDVALITEADGVYLREIPTFNFTTQTLVKLGGPEIISPIWDPLNPERLAFAYFTAGGERSLVFSDKRLTKMDRKADLSAIPNPKLIWSPNDAYILLVARSSDPGLENLWVYTTADGTLKQLTTGGSILDASFSPDSGIILYESQSAGISVLGTMKPDGSGQKQLNVAGKVAQAAWKGSSGFYLPSQNSNAITSYGIDGTSKEVVFAFPTQLSIKGMFYFGTSKTLIFYTDSSLYTVGLAL
ncbi:MAG: hypothetical protein WCO52_05840 [bacterium]